MDPSRMFDSLRNLFEKGDRPEEKLLVKEEKLRVQASNEPTQQIFRVPLLCLIALIERIMQQ